MAQRFGWDDEVGGLGGRVASLRERLPGDLREAPRGPAFEALPFSPLYLLGDEWAAEVANRTMHGVLHLGWVPDPGRDGQGGWREQMAALVKPNGWRGSAYMAAIRPFRLWIVYPRLMRAIEREADARLAAD